MSSEKKKKKNRARIKSISRVTPRSRLNDHTSLKLPIQHKEGTAPKRIRPSTSKPRSNIKRQGIKKRITSARTTTIQRTSARPTSAKRPMSAKRPTSARSIAIRRFSMQHTQPKKETMKENIKETPDSPDENNLINSIVKSYKLNLESKSIKEPRLEHQHQQPRIRPQTAKQPKRHVKRQIERPLSSRINIDPSLMPPMLVDNSNPHQILVPSKIQTPRKTISSKYSQNTLSPRQEPSPRVVTAVNLSTTPSKTRPISAKRRASSQFTPPSNKQTSKKKRKRSAAIRIRMPPPLIFDKKAFLEQCQPSTLLAIGGSFDELGKQRNYILRYIFLNFLDLRSLIQVSMTCKCCFYISMHHMLENKS
mmetsp:Transcript_12545/g.18791  ORF Transcript_12545/g.18791 Transcript_12545/m.18791 type:complete len:364 (+) Transcript_12545:339-1430(+)